AALRLRAREDRAESDHGGFRQEAAGAGAGHQTRPLSRIIALRDPLADDSAQTEHKRASSSGRARQHERPLRPSSPALVHSAKVGTELDPSLTADEAGQLKMMQIIFVGLGGGAAAALLFASAGWGLVAGILPFYFSA